MATVVFDNTAANDSASSTTVSVTMTVGPSGNAVCITALSALGVETSFTVVDDTSGTPWALIVGTDTGSSATSLRQMMFGKANVTPGSRTFTLTVGTPNYIIIGAVSALNVNQLTPFINGTHTGGTSNNPSMAITTATNDMTLDTLSTTVAAPYSPTQTQAWINSGSGASYDETTSGTSNTHAWTLSTSRVWLDSGADFQASSSAPPVLSAGSLSIPQLNFVKLRRAL